MNRIEFAQLMVEAKQKSGKRMCDLLRSTGCAFTQLRRMENALHNFCLDNVFKYLDGIGYSIYIKDTKSGTEYVVSCSEGLMQTARDIIKFRGLSGRKAAVASKISQPTLLGMTSNRFNTAIETLLKFADAFDCTIDIKPLN